jgi:hypothetical protein
MAHDTEMAPPSATIADTRTPEGSPPRDRTPGRRPAASKLRFPLWWVAIAVVVAVYLSDTLPPYLTGDPAKARIVLRKDIPWHYPLLLCHITFGTIALVTLVLQLWPWVRRNHPRVHRATGLTYVFAGALPTATTALVLNALTDGWSANIGIAFHAVLWFTTATLGFRAALQHRWIDHRKWMYYSAALALGILWGRATVVFYTQFPKFDIHYVFEVARWAGWMTNLIFIYWWVERTTPRAFPAPQTVPGEPETVGR